MIAAEPVRVLDAADEHGRFAVEVLGALGATVTSAAPDAAALAAADVAVVGGGAREWIVRRGDWPRLVLVAVTPFGLDGPRAAWRGGELVAQAAGGLVWPNGHPHQPPLPLPDRQVTRCAGMHAALGALLALIARRRDGRGALVDVSLQESAAAMLEHVAGEWFDRGDPARRQGTLHWNGTFRVGRCRDGDVLLSHVGDWTALREWLLADGAAADLAAPRWDDPDERCRHAAQVFDVLDRWALGYAVEELVARAQLLRLPFASVRDREGLGDQAEGGLGARALGARGPEASRVSAPLVPPATSEPRAPSPEPRPPHPHSRPLAGVRVVDLTWVVAGPLATRVLADFGAEVVRVERVDAPAASGTTAANLRRGKRAVRLDLRVAADLAAARELLRQADVVVDNFSRRVLPNLGLDDAALRALNPRLIVAHLPAFAAADPRADWVAFGPTLHALCGLTAAMRHPGGAPAGAGFAYSDTASGWAMALAIAAALWRRAADGDGAVIDLAQHDVLAMLLAGAASAPPGVIVRCADDAGQERWCAVESDDPRLAARLREAPAEDAVARLQADGISAAIVATPADLAADPQLLHRGWWRRDAGVAMDGVVPVLRR